MVEGTEVIGDEAAVMYTVPMPSDGVARESAPVLDFVKSAPLARTRTRFMRSSTNRWWRGCTPSLVQPVGKGRWRGRWRSFQTGHSNVVYATRLDGEKAKVFLSLNGAGRQQRYRDLLLLRDTLQPYLDQLLWLRMTRPTRWRVPIEALRGLAS